MSVRKSVAILNIAWVSLAELFQSAHGISVLLDGRLEFLEQAINIS